MLGIPMLIGMLPCYLVWRAFRLIRRAGVHGAADVQARATKAEERAVLEQGTGSVLLIADLGFGIDVINDVLLVHAERAVPGRVRIWDPDSRAHRARTAIGRDRVTSYTVVSGSYRTRVRTTADPVHPSGRP